MPKKQAGAMRVRDLTQGPPLRLVLKFAVPLLIGNVFQQIYTMVDTVVLGRSLGDGAIAAVGATAALYALLVDLAIGMNGGCGIVVTQYFGAKNDEMLRRSIAGLLALNLAVGLGLTGLSLAFLRPLLRCMNTPAALLDQAYAYLAILCGGMLTTIAYNAFAAILRAVGNSRAPLYFLIAACAVNVALDLLLVAGLHLGMAGAAVATVLAQAVSAALCGGYLVWNCRALLPGRADFRRMGACLPELLSSGASMALMYCVVDLGSTIFQRSANLLGQTAIAAHTAARRIMGIAMQPLGTLASANATFAGQNWGAERTDRIRTTLRQVIGVGLAWSVLSFCAVWWFGDALVRFTTGTDNPETIQNAVRSLRIHLSGFPALTVVLCLRTAMQAVGQKRAPVISSGIELGMKLLAAWRLVPRLGFLGVCVTEPVTWVLMTAFLLVAYAARTRKLLAPKPCCLRAA